MGRLSTHVLDTASGKPAAGVEIRLYAVHGEERKLLKSATTNADGRTDAPLLTGDELVAGIYELIFCAGNYHRAQSEKLVVPAFLDEIAVRFGVAEPAANYHVPLLLSPYSYSTYRGS
jgi:5-hydroxyisourate hydrolase